MIQWRKHKLGRAETGAMERVIRAALSMKHAYTLEELKKPFVIPRIDFSPDYNDPAVKRMMIENGMRAMNGLFAQHAALPDLTDPNNVFISTAQVDELGPDDTPFTPADAPDEPETITPAIS